MPDWLLANLPCAFAWAVGVATLPAVGLLWLAWLALSAWLEGLAARRVTLLDGAALLRWWRAWQSRRGMAHVVRRYDRRGGLLGWRL